MAAPFQVDSLNAAGRFQARRRESSRTGALTPYRACRDTSMSFDIHDQIDLALGRGAACYVLRVTSHERDNPGWEIELILFDGDDPCEQVYVRYVAPREYWRLHILPGRDLARIIHQSGTRTTRVRPAEVTTLGALRRMEPTIHG